MNPQVATEVAHLRGGMERLIAGQVGPTGAPIAVLHHTAALVARWRETEARVDAMIRGAEERRRAAEARLEALRGRPAPLLGSRAAASLTAEVRRAEAEIDAAREEETEARRLRTERDLLAECKRVAPAVLAPLLARIVAVTERRAADLTQDLRHTAVALLRAIDDADAAHRLAEELAGGPVSAPRITLPGRDGIERLARGESAVIAAAEVP